MIMSWFCGDNPCERPNCSYDIWAPDHRSKVVNTAFSAYAFHQQEIEDFIEVLAATDDPNDRANQYAAARCVGLDPNSLTSDEIKYIEREVAKRI
jgi:hypothetical protein